MIPIQLTKRQQEIIRFVKQSEPITGDKIAEHLKLTRATIRADLSILTMTGILDARPKVGYFFSGLEANPAVYEEIRNASVTSIMTTPILITKTVSIYDAIVTLFLEDTGSLYVSDEQKLIGLVSRKDLLKSAIAGTDTKLTPVATIMTRMPNIITLSKDETLCRAAELLVAHQIDSLPVMDGEVTVGKISKSSLTQVSLKLLKKV